MWQGRMPLNFGSGIRDWLVEHLLGVDGRERVAQR